MIMKPKHLLPFALMGLAALSLGAGCPTVPKIEDRSVQLAAGASTTLTIPAEGIVNVWDQAGVEDLAADVDVASLASKSGIDLSNVDHIKLSGVSYRVTVPDPNPGRTVTGTVSARRGVSGTETPLITSFSQNVDAATDWQKAPLDANGVALLNGLLNDLLNAAQNHTSASNTSVVYHVQGTSSPTDANTNFTWQIKLDFTFSGRVHVKVLN